MVIRRRHVAAVVATVSAVLAVAAVWTYTSVVPRQFSRRFTDNMLREHGLQLDLDAVRGAAHGEILLLHPRISTLGDSSRVLMYADAVRVRPRELRALLEGRVTLGLLRVERPRVEWPAAGIGARRAAKPDGGPPRFPRLKIERLEIQDARVTDARRGGDGLVVDHVDVRGAVDAEPSALAVVIEAGSVVFPHDSLRVDAMHGEVSVRGDSIVIRQARVRTAGSEVEFAASLPWNLHRARGTLHAAALDFAELARIAPRLPPRGRLQGDVQFDWNGGQCALRGKAGGRVDRWTLEDGVFDVVLGAGRRLAVRTARGRVNGAHFEGEGDFGPQGYEGSVRFADLNCRALDSLRTAGWPAHDLRGSLRFQRTAPHDSTRCEVVLGAGTVDGVQIDNAQIDVVIGGTGTAVGGAVRRGAVQSPLGALEFSGRGNAAQVDAAFVLRTPAVERLLAWARRPGLAGDVEVTGRVSGPAKAPNIEAESRFRSWAAGPVRAWGGTWSLWGRGLGREADIEAQLRTDSLRVRGHVWRALNADLAWSHGALHVTRSQAVAGDSLLALAATIEPRPTDWSGRRVATTRLRVETLLARFGSTELRVEDPGVAWWRKGAAHVDSLELVTRGGRLQVSGTLDWGARNIDAYAVVHDVDAGLLKQLLRAHWPVDGVASGSIRARGPIDHVALDGDWSAVDGRWVELPVDSVHVHLESDAQGIAARDLRLRSPYGSVRGEVRLGTLPSLAALWERGAQAPLRERVAGASVEATLWLADVDVARWVARGRTPALPRWGGRVSSTITIAGTASAPHARITGAADDVHVGRRDIGAFTFGAEYRDEQLLLHEMRISSGDRLATASAEVPVRVDFTRGVLWYRDRDVRAHLELPRGSAAMVRRFIPIFEAPPAPLAAGTIGGQLDIDGKLASPRIHGGFVVDNAAFTLRDMEELYQDAHAVGTFDGTTLRVTEMRGKTGDRGLVTGAGEVKFKGWLVDTYKYDLDVQRAPVYSLPEISAVVSGQLTIEGARVANDRLLVPNITGTLDVLEARITQEFTNDAAESQLFDTDAPPWLATPNLTLRAEKGNVWLDNSLVDAELAGTLQIMRTRRQLDFRGNVTVKRGKYLDYLHYFNIKDGELDFSANPGFNPKLDIHGETGRPGDKTYVSLTGTAMEPRLQFTADAVGKGEQEIQQEIIGSTDAGSIVSKGAQELVEPMLGEARGLFAGVRDVPILRGLSELRGSVDPAGRQVSQNRTTTDTGTNTGPLANLDLNVTAGVPLAEDVYLVYQHGLGGDLQQRVGVEWGLWRRLVLEGAWERERINYAGPDRTQNAVDVNLKFRYER